MTLSYPVLEIDVNLTKEYQVKKVKWHDVWPIYNLGLDILVIKSV